MIMVAITLALVRVHSNWEANRSSEVVRTSSKIMCNSTLMSLISWSKGNNQYSFYREKKIMSRRAANEIGCKTMERVGCKSNWKLSKDRNSMSQICLKERGYHLSLLKASSVSSEDKYLTNRQQSANKTPIFNSTWRTARRVAVCLVFRTKYSTMVYPSIRQTESWLGPLQRPQETLLKLANR